MTDTLTLAGLSATALTEGIRFLYGQTDDILKRHRDRAAKRSEKQETPAVVALPRELPLPDPDLVQRFEGDLEFFRAYLEPYVTGPQQVELERGQVDPRILDAADALRGLLGSVHQTPIVFVEERGDAQTASVVQGSVDVETLAGIAIAVRAKLASGRIRGDAKAGLVEAGGELIGVDLGGED